MDRELLRNLRWAYNYLCLPRGSLLIRRLHEEITEQDEPNPLFLDADFDHMVAFYLHGSLIPWKIAPLFTPSQSNLTSGVTTTCILSKSWLTGIHVPLHSRSSTGPTMDTTTSPE